MYANDEWVKAATVFTNLGTRMNKCAAIYRQNNACDECGEQKVEKFEGGVMVCPNCEATHGG